jgi:hypothetical protein
MCLSLSKVEVVHNGCLLTAMDAVPWLPLSAAGDKQFWHQHRVVT